MLTGLLTGHCSLKYHYIKLVRLMRFRISTPCAETAEHILCRYPAVCRRRLLYFEVITKLCEIMQMNLRDILKQLQITLKHGQGNDYKRSFRSK